MGANAKYILRGIGDICVPITAGPNERMIATRYGDPHQIEKEIHLCESFYYKGRLFKASGSTPSVLPPMKVYSFHFTGNYSRLFSGLNYTGNSTCLKSQTDGRDWGITDDNIFNGLIVRSIKSGC